MKVTLHSYWRSSSAWRVRIALGFKDIPYENVPVDLMADGPDRAEGGQQNAPEFRAKNPMAQVPLFEIEEAGQVIRLAQSVAIIEYIEARFPEPRLIPEDLYRAAKARQLVEMVNAGIQPIQNLRVMRAVVEMGGEKLAWGRQIIARGFDALEAEAKPLAGRYLIGDRVTIADLFLVPQMYNARRFEVDLSPYPTLNRVERACAELPPFAAAHPDKQPDAPSSV